MYNLSFTEFILITWLATKEKVINAQMQEL